MIFIGPTKSTLEQVRPPTTLRQTVSDLDSSSTTRTASGKMVRSVLRGGDKSIRKLEFSWDLIDEREARQILKLVKTSFFYIQYYDILSGAVRTVQFYAGDKTIDFRRVMVDGRVMIQNLSFNVIER